ncbi:MAG: hypothetical protein HXY43_05225 [Fischerella sp.]|nr:hypothetical protein [Fischerella sp.]NWF58715.1 hypothetical protein [Fischerella sp.]
MQQCFYLSDRYGTFLFVVGLRQQNAQYPLTESYTMLQTNINAQFLPLQ